MTRDEVLSMKPGRELDALVARKLFHIHNPDPRWKPSEEISEAWGDVEEEIRIRGLQMEYLYELMRVTGVSDFQLHSVFELVHASPADRCKAALLALEGGEGE